MRLPVNRDDWIDLADGAWRASTPFILVVPLIAVMALPVHLPWHPWMPQLGLAAVMYWVTIKPEWMPPLAAMVLGLLQDFWLGSPLGLMMIVYGLTAAFLSAQITFFLARPFHIGWGVLALMIVAIAFLLWLATSAILGQNLPLGGFLLQAGLTILMMPLLFFLLALCLTRLLDRRRSLGL